MKFSIPSVLPCLVCGVDSRPVLIFYGVLVGSVILASLSFLVWGIGAGKFSGGRMEQRPLDVEVGDE